MIPREVVELIDRLANSTDIHRFLEERKVSAIQALRAMCSTSGRRERRALRRLAKMHSEIIAHRYSPYAVHKLCELLSNEKAEIRLKGALSLLEIAGLRADRMRGKRGEKGQGGASETRMDEEEAAEMLSALAEVRERRRAERVGRNYER